MKNFLFFLLVFVFFILSFFVVADRADNQENIANKEEENTKEEKRAVFFSYIEINKYLKNKTTSDSKKNIQAILDNLLKHNFNMLILHVRAFSDSIYPSKIYEQSDGVKNNNSLPEYDILDFFIKEAKKRNIEIHAWINPYRISTSTDLNSISKNHVAYNLINKGCVKVIEDKGIYYSPGCEEVNKLIVDGIVELVSNYKIDGVHFDDYFYPGDEIDLDNYKEYIDKGGILPLAEYRYNNILTLLKNVYSSIKNINKDVVFGISPEGNIDNDYNNHYLDIKTILSEDGYIDYVMPQIYFGFNNSNRPFTKTLKTWNDMIKNKNIKLLPALAFYKSGKEDKYANNGKNEWKEENDIIKRQVLESRSVGQYDGFSLFRYEFLFEKDKQNDNMASEFNNLKEILK